MNSSTVFGRALSPVELSHSRYLDALIAFRPESCLRMDDPPVPTPPTPTPPAPVPTPPTPPAPAPGTPPGNALDDQGKDLGFPKDTPVAEMKAEQQTAYWRNEAQKHQGRYKNLTGDRSFDETKAALEEHAKFQRDQQTPAEQALADARTQGKTEGLTAARTEAASAIFRGALEAGGIPEADIEELATNFNVGNFIGDNGIETAKITAFAKRFTTPGTGTPPTRRDYGAGQRPPGAPARGAAGQAEADRRFPKQKTS